ncbi:MAG: hypothetical protein JSR17_06520 [Proteobacteria bacterium]|nr:hypothetical protein [Pseudomonadota bacterium]
MLAIGWQAARKAIRLFYSLTQSFGIFKIPAYLLTAFLLVWFGPTLALGAGLRTLLALALSPFVFDIASMMFTVAVGLVIRSASLFTRDVQTESKFNTALIANNEVRALSLVRNCRSPEMLVNFGIKVITHPNDAIFNAIVARLNALGPRSLAHNHNQLFRAAVYHKRIDYVKTLLGNNAVAQHAHVNKNEALREACIQGDMDMLEALLNVQVIFDNVYVNNNEAIRLAEREGKWDVVARLLLIPMVAEFRYPEGVKLDFTERHIQQYGQPQVMAAPRAVDNSIPAEPHIPPENHWLLNALNGYLNIHRERPREEAPRDLYVPEESDHDLRDIGGRESSMRELNARQHAALEDIRKRYGAVYAAKGRDAIFEEIKEYMEAEYQQNPATYFKIGLPLHMGKILTWLTNNRAYYQHPVHGAWRYLFLGDSNPWRSIASYTQGLTSDIKEEIALMWLAATDKDAKFPEGQSRESVLVEFCQTMCELARAHNHDRARPCINVRKDSFTNQQEYYFTTETYDDLEGDRYTCGGGMNRRLSNFYMLILNDRPETRMLTADAMRSKFQQEMVNESPLPASMYKKLKAMDAKTLQNLLKVLSKKFESLDDLSEEESALFNRLAFTEGEIAAFVKTCQAYYGANRITERRENNKIVFNHHRFASFAEMIALLGKTATEEFYNDIKRNIENILRDAPKQQDKAPVDRRKKATAVVHSTSPAKSREKKSSEASNDEGPKLSSKGKPRKSARR